MRRLQPAQAVIEAGDDGDAARCGGGLRSAERTHPGRTSASQPASQPADSDDRPYNLRYELPDKLKRILSSQIGTDVADLPSDYYGYLRMLHDRGVAVTFDGAMAHLVGLSSSVTEESLVDIATRLGLVEVLDHRAAAEVYLVY